LKEERRKKKKEKKYVRDVFQKNYQPLIVLTKAGTTNKTDNKDLVGYKFFSILSCEFGSRQCLKN